MNVSYMIHASSTFPTSHLHLLMRHRIYTPSLFCHVSLVTRRQKPNNDTPHTSGYETETQLFNRNSTEFANMPEGLTGLIVIIATPTIPLIALGI